MKTLVFCLSVAVLVLASGITSANPGRSHPPAEASLMIATFDVDAGPVISGRLLLTSRGGYEITVSNVGPESENILMSAIGKLLKAN